MSSILFLLVDTVNHMPEMPKNTHDDVMEAMHELMHLARALQRRNMPDDGLHPVEGKALGYFVRNPGGTQSDLVQYSGRDKGQMARLIAGLREKGLLMAEPDAQDRRVTRLYPSEEAQKLHAEVMQQRRQVAAQATAGFTAAERQSVLDALQRMQANLREAGARLD